MATKIARYYLPIDVIEEGRLVAGDVQGPATYRHGDIGGFRALHADGQEDGSPAGGTDAKIAGLCTQVLPYLVTKGDLRGYLFITTTPVPSSAP
jgi:hypothetical protein